MARAGRGARELTFGRSRDKLLKPLNSCGLGLTELDPRGSSAVSLGTLFISSSQLLVLIRNGLLRSAGGSVPMLLEQPEEMLGTNQVNLAWSLEEGQDIGAGHIPIKAF